VFKRAGTHGTPASHLMYNKMLVATLLFNEYHTGRLIHFLGNNPQVERGAQIFSKNKKEIFQKKKEYEQKIVVDVREWCKRWNIDFRDNT